MASIKISRLISTAFTPTTLHTVTLSTVPLHMRNHSKLVLRYTVQLNMTVVTTNPCYFQPQSPLYSGPSLW